MADRYFERFVLCKERIEQLMEEELVAEPFAGYFHCVGAFLLRLVQIRELVDKNELCKLSLSELQTQNQDVYSNFIDENYENSFANPDYMFELCKSCGVSLKISQMLCALFTKMSRVIAFAYENDLESMTLHLELFVEVYGLFEMAYSEGSLTPKEDSLKDCLYWFESDNCDIFIPKKIKTMIDPEGNFASEIVMKSDLNDMRYLYMYGEYVTENELKIASYLNSLPRERIQDIAKTYTEGYRIGFLRNGKDLSKKRTVDIRYCLGFERIVREAIFCFEELGLKPVIRRGAFTAVNKIGYYGAVPSRQFTFDHKEDDALVLDHDYLNRYAGVLKTTFEEMKHIAKLYGGPAVIEIFGETPFTPKKKDTVLSYTPAMHKLSVELMSVNSKITNQYIIGEERSFTIIAYPVPEIGEKFEEIFDETVKINTLDYELYEKMQQILIDLLDRAEHVRIVGANGNETNLVVNLVTLKDPSKETKFENCVADVNIPVGEVFTSPKLAGTNGLLHVKQVYLDGLKYVDLRLRFQDGMISEYSCNNFEKEEDNQRFIKDNLLFHHETLPMGEFAIGTNTTAYRMARLYGIEEKLPTLIGEKTGPHFAVGDTCYKYEEEITSYNPDGKAIVARENEVSALRKSKPDAAYYNCHTDITIPYDELGGIYAVHQDGSETAIIENGYFVPEEVWELNKPLKNM